jgi:hypothetical protein
MAETHGCYREWSAENFRDIAAQVSRPRPSDRTRRQSRIGGTWRPSSSLRLERTLDCLHLSSKNDPRARRALGPLSGQELKRKCYLFLLTTALAAFSLAANGPVALAPEWTTGSFGPNAFSLRTGSMATGRRIVS